MPLDMRFSKNKFIENENQGITNESLIGALEVEIQNELHEVIMPRVREIVERLNAMGHQLKEYIPPEAGDISFRDDREESGRYKCSLRIGVDTVVSIGFNDTKDEANEDSQSKKE